MELTQEFLKSILCYDPVLGTWTWLHRPTGSAQWNGHFAGKTAGGLDPSTGYLRIRIGNKLLYGHRLAFLYMTGSWPANRSDNTSGFKGVSLDKRSGKWVSDFRINGKRFRRHGFSTAELAHEAYCKDAFEHGGEFARVA